MSRRQTSCDRAMAREDRALGNPTRWDDDEKLISTKFQAGVDQCRQIEPLLKVINKGNPTAAVGRVPLAGRVQIVEFSRVKGSPKTPTVLLDWTSFEEALDFVRKMV